MEREGLTVITPWLVCLVSQDFLMLDFFFFREGDTLLFIILICVEFIEV